MKSCLLPVMTKYSNNAPSSIHYVDQLTGLLDQSSGRKSQASVDEYVMLVPAILSSHSLSGDKQVAKRLQHGIQFILVRLFPPATKIFIIAQTCQPILLPNPKGKLFSSMPTKGHLETIFPVDRVWVLEVTQSSMEATTKTRTTTSKTKTKLNAMSLHHQVADGEKALQRQAKAEHLHLRNERLKNLRRIRKREGKAGGAENEVVEVNQSQVVGVAADDPAAAEEVPRREAIWNLELIHFCGTWEALTLLSRKYNIFAKCSSLRVGRAELG